MNIFSLGVRATLVAERDQSQHMHEEAFGSVIIIIIMNIIKNK